VERRAGRKLGSLLGLGAISGSESASSKIPRHSSTAAPPAQPPASPTGHSASYPTANNISISVPGFFHRQFRHASALASLCLSSPSLHSLFIIPFAHSFIAPLFVPRCLHHESSRQPFANLVFLPRPQPIRDSGTLAPSIYPSIHPSIRDCETYTIVLITSIHDD
jgi:hypothetical protein